MPAVEPLGERSEVPFLERVAREPGRCRARRLDRVRVARPQQRRRQWDEHECDEPERPCSPSASADGLVGRYPSAGSTQNTAVVGFTNIPTSPAASAKPPTAGRLFSRHAIVAQAKPTAPAVARYSIIDVRPHRTANGVETKATSAASAADLPVHLADEAVEEERRQEEAQQAR